MINAPNHTFFGSGHGISCPGQADSECGATIQGQANRLRGAGVVRYRFDNARPSGAPQGHARVAG
jgi:hypothetical protein